MVTEVTTPAPDFLAGIRFLRFYLRNPYDPIVVPFLGRLAGYLRERQALGRWALRCLPDVRWTVNVAPVGPFRIRVRQHRSYWLHSPLLQDQFFFGALQRLIRPGDVVYDVGANIGLYVRFLIQHFQAGHVVAFEPMDDTFQLLKTNVGLNPEVAQKTTLLKLALADVEGEEDFQVDDVSSASSTLDRVTGGAPAKAREQYGLPPRVERVKVMPLDLVVEREKLPPPSLIKLDIEGAGGLALAGMSRTIQAHHPDFIIETHGLDEARSTLTTLRGHGYHCFSVTERDGVTRYCEVLESDIKPLPKSWQPRQFLASMQIEKLREEITPHHCWISAAKSADNVR